LTEHYFLWYNKLWDEWQSTKTRLKGRLPKREQEKMLTTWLRHCFRQLSSDDRRTLREAKKLLGVRQTSVYTLLELFVALELLVMSVAEDCLKREVERAVLVALFWLGPAGSAALKDEVGFSRPTIISALKSLKESGLVAQPRYGVWALTETGRAVAVYVLDKTLWWCSCGFRVFSDEKVHKEGTVIQCPRCGRELNA